MTRQVCSAHCAGCGQHFHGLGAFDAHLSHEQGFTEHLVASVVTSIRNPHKFLLQSWTEIGFCDKGRGCWVNGKRVKWDHPVTIWQVRLTEADQNRLQHLRSSQQRPKGVKVVSVGGEG